jgi:hypothetical protein
VRCRRIVTYGSATDDGMLDRLKAPTWLASLERALRALFLGGGGTPAAALIITRFTCAKARVDLAGYTAGNWSKHGCAPNAHTESVIQEHDVRSDGYVGARGWGVEERNDAAKSDHTNVLSFLTLAAGGDVELDALALVERLEAAALDVGEVDEHVVALLSRNEAEALLGVEELHGTRSQRTLSSVLSLSV